MIDFKTFKRIGFAVSKPDDFGTYDINVICPLSDKRIFGENILVRERSQLRSFVVSDVYFSLALKDDRAVFQEARSTATSTTKNRYWTDAA